VKSFQAADMTGRMQVLVGCCGAGVINLLVDCLCREVTAVTVVTGVTAVLKYAENNMAIHVCAAAAAAAGSGSSALHVAVWGLVDTTTDTSKALALHCLQHCLQ
jgi:hypothetical protein